MNAEGGLRIVVGLTFLIGFTSHAQLVKAQNTDYCGSVIYTNKANVVVTDKVEWVTSDSLKIKTRTGIRNYQLYELDPSYVSNVLSQVMDRPAFTSQDVADYEMAAQIESQGAKFFAWFFPEAELIAIHKALRANYSDRDGELVSFRDTGYERISGKVLSIVDRETLLLTTGDFDVIALRGYPTTGVRNNQTIKTVGLESGLYDYITAIGSQNRVLQYDAVFIPDLSYKDFRTHAAMTDGKAFPEIAKAARDHLVRQANLAAKELAARKAAWEKEEALAKAEEDKRKAARKASHDAWHLKGPEDF